MRQKPKEADTEKDSELYNLPATSFLNSSTLKVKMHPTQHSFLLFICDTVFDVYRIRIVYIPT